MTEQFKQDIAMLKTLLAPLPTEWEGKATVLEMKEASFQWRQTEWWAFYFELLCSRFLAGEFQVGRFLPKC